MVAINDSTEETTSSPSNVLMFPVDAEHAGIRSVGCLAMVALGFGLFFLGGTFTNLPAMVIIIASIISASAFSYGLEKYLKARWPSGRVLEVHDTAIAIRNKRAIERSIDPQQQINVLTWNFKVKRSSRVKKGWHVVGFSLEQEGDYIPVYTFASPADFEKLPLSKHFTRLEKADAGKDKKEKAKSVVTMRQAGEQRRLHEAEYDRGLFGAELTLAQFTEYLEFLQKNYPKWMIS
jgi:hypothetical protein